MEIRPVLTQEVDLLVALAAKLWPHHSKEELSEEFCEFLSCGIIFAAFEDSQMVGFAQCSLRNDYVERCSHSPVGYLEGIFVLENYRQKGISRQLLSSCETWAKNKAAGNLPAIVSWIIPRAFPFILPVVLRKQIELSVLRKRYKWS